MKLRFVMGEGGSCDAGREGECENHGNQKSSSK